MLAEAEGEAERRRILLRALGDALVTLPRTWLDEVRALSAVPVLRGTLGLDVRLGLRRLRRAPAFTAVGVLTLALAIGAVSAVFTTLDAFFFRPLPYAEPQELVVLWETPEGSSEPNTVSPANFKDWRRQMTTLDDVAAFNGTNAVLTAAGEASLVPASVVTTNFFDVLGVRPALGSGFLEEHALEADTAAPAPVVVLGHGLWVRHFGADPAVVGRSVEIADRPHEVVGVMPRGFRHPRTFNGLTPAQLWLPIGFGSSADRRDVPYLHVFARLRDGATVDAVRAEMEAVWSGLVERYPEDLAAKSTLVVPIDEQIFGEQRPLLALLLGAAGLLLLVASVNMANLQLARGLGREREFAVQAAIGSGRAGIARQLLIECGIVALGGGLAGMLLVVGGEKVLAAIVTPYLNPLARIEPDLAVVGFTLAVTAGSGLLFGLLPAVGLSRKDLAATLRERNPGPATGGARSFLVATEVALTLVLIFGAGLLGRSFLRLSSVEPGFAVESNVVFQVRVPSERYREAEEVFGYYDRLEERMEAHPSFDAVAFVSDVPLTSENRTTTFTVPDSDEPEREREVEYHAVSHDYLETAGITLLEGRGFLPGDGRDEAVTIVNRALAERFFGDGRAIDRVLEFSRGSTRVVGVVAATVDDGLDEAPQPRAYFPHAGRPSRIMWGVARASGSPESALGRVREMVRDVDPEVPISDLRTMRDHVASSVAKPMGAAAVMGGFGALALLMAALGIYGVLTSAVAERTRELGVRAALGAARGELVSLVLRRSLTLTGLGMAVGFFGAPLAGSLLRSQLFGVAAWDPAVLVTAASTVALTALAAAWIPAVRAARVSPLVAIRAE
ncbi:MAG: ABC transporter permease [Gemmatimonadetes bacterium]|nr:ABC transporter permease [Gemmatimonadota bacterium]NIP80479.1 ABC transporter permease [Gemmatimonadota bacterium]NIR80377.1 ABC transporter permease [Gemmatimonadota bacterium]NIU32937.1 ABC transporter permease [Gemmatimonadota bacterium]NIU37336.1 hypothetical protein [Gemmatimonadota bacterium]